MNSSRLPQNFCPSLLVTLNLVKRLLEAGCRNGSPSAFSQQFPLGGQIRTSRHAVTKPRDTSEETQRDPKARIWHLIPGLDGNLNTPEKPSHAPAQR